MKKKVALLFVLLFVGNVIAQQASNYFPSQTGFEWKYKAIPLDSASNPMNELAYYRMDKFESVADYHGKSANIVLTKSGPLQSITLQPYLDSLFYSTEGTTGYSYFSVGNIERFLNSLDSLGITTNFNFLNFFKSLQNWYDYYRFASPVNTAYTLIQKDTTIAIGSLNVPFRFKYTGNRLNDQSISTVKGDLTCKKFLLQWKILSYTVVELLTLNDTVWIAPDNWIVQDIIPGQYVDNLSMLGVSPFSIPGLDVRLTEDIVDMKNEEQILSDFSLEQNFPNPFNPSTKIKYSIPSVTLRQSQSDNWVTLKVYDILGNEVATLVNEYKPAGNYEVEFQSTVNNHQLASGIYFYRLQAGSFVKTKKMILLR